MDVQYVQTQRAESHIVGKHQHIQQLLADASGLVVHVALMVRGSVEARCAGERSLDTHELLSPKL